MHRIDASGHVSNQFSMGDPTIGAPATQVDADWFNAVQENVCQFIEYMGITLTKGNHTQLRLAVLALLARANTFTAAQTISAALSLLANLNFTASATQNIFKSGGALGVGTSDANQVSLFTAGSNRIVVRADGSIGFYGNPFDSVGRLGFSGAASDPSGVAGGTLWYNTANAKLSAMINSIVERLATESWVTGTAGSTSNIANTLARRDANGRLAFGDPSAANHGATMAYADTRDAATLASAKAYADGLASAWGFIGSDGSLSSGRGITSSRTSAGVYAISFSPARANANFASALTRNTASGRGFIEDGLHTASGFTVYTFNSSGAAADCNFSVAVFG